MAEGSHPLCAILSGSWRGQPAPARVSAEALADCLPVLSSTGAAGLAWNRVKLNERLAPSGPALELRQHARTQVLDGARHEVALGALLRLLDSAHVAPILFKGRALARYYAQPHLRAMGDVDLCAPPGRFDELAGLLRGNGFLEITRVSGGAHGRATMLAAPADWPSMRLLIDLHERFDSLAVGSLADVFMRAKPLEVGGGSILIPAAEDHIRIVAIHFLRDGGWRPSSLCDLGAILESLPASFDWGLCLGADERRRRWIAASLELAHTLLGAGLGRMPAKCRVRDLPPWLGATVLGAWQRPFSHHGPRVPFRTVLRRHFTRVPAEMRARWPNGLRASIELDAALTRSPRWPYQFLYIARAAGRFTRRRLGAKAG